MNDALAQLRDLHAPAPPAWWPPAPGWWMVAALAVAALIWCVRAWRQRSLRHAPFRVARAQLRELADQPSASDDAAFADAANALVKRVLIYGLHRPDAAALTDTQWLAYLDECMGEPCFSAGNSAVLGNARFAAQPQVDRAELTRDLDALLARLERLA